MSRTPQQLLKAPTTSFLVLLGKRACPGEQLARIEVFLYTAILAQNYRMSIPANSPPVKGEFGITWRPVDFDLEVQEVNKIEA